MSEWLMVQQFVKRAKLIGFDECHKIYIATDQHEADYFTQNEWKTFQGSPSEMLEVLEEWYEDSCSLRFISAVEFDQENDQTVFTTLVPQG